MWPQTVWGHADAFVPASTAVLSVCGPNQTVLRANISVPRWVAWSWDRKETHPWPGWQQKWVKRFIMPYDQHDTVFTAKWQIAPRNVKYVAAHYVSASQAIQIMDEGKAWSNYRRVKLVYSLLFIKKTFFKKVEIAKICMGNTSPGRAICLSMLGEAMSICRPSGLPERMLHKERGVVKESVNFQTLEGKNRTIADCFHPGQFTWVECHTNASTHPTHL